MRPGPSVALQLVAGSTALALSVRGWHSPEMAVLGGALLLRVGFDLERKRPTKAPPIPRRHARVPPPAGPVRSGGRAAWSQGPARVAAWARCDRGADPAQVRLDRDWLAAQRQPTSATAAASVSPAARSTTTRRPDPTRRAAGWSETVPASPTNHREDP
jgi:hypothetical protein